MEWKVPISSTIYEAFGKDHLARDLFIHMLLKTRNKDMTKTDYYFGKPYLLKKGQLIFGRRAYAEKLRSKPTTVVDALRRLTNRQDDHQIIAYPTHNFTIVTLIFYNKLVKMTGHMTTKPTTNRQALLQPTDTNKNDKNDKNEIDKTPRLNFSLLSEKSLQAKHRHESSL